MHCLIVSDTGNSCISAKHRSVLPLYMLDVGDITLVCSPAHCIAGHVKGHAFTRIHNVVASSNCAEKARCLLTQATHVWLHLQHLMLCSQSMAGSVVQLGAMSLTVSTLQTALGKVTQSASQSAYSAYCTAEWMSSRPLTFWAALCDSIIYISQCPEPESVSWCMRVCLRATTSGIS